MLVSSRFYQSPLHNKLIALTLSLFINFFFSGLGRCNKFWYMKTIKLTALASLFALSIVGCQEKQPEKLSPITTEIGGNLGSLYEIVDGEYPYPTVSNQFEFKIKRNENEGYNYSKVGIGYELYDKDGNVIEAETNPALESITSWSSIPSSVMELQPGEIGTMYILLEGWPDKHSKAKTFKLILESNTDDTNTTNLSSSANNQLDKLLNDYETFINDYESYISEMESGNINTKKITDMTSKAQKMQENLVNKQPEMNSKQIQRLGRISSKLTKIASKISTMNTENIKSINGINIENLGI